MRQTSSEIEGLEHLWPVRDGPLRKDFSILLTDLMAKLRVLRPVLACKVSIV